MMSSQFDYDGLNQKAQNLGLDSYEELALKTRNKNGHVLETTHRSAIFYRMM